ncbi:31168_t:CDS:2 [Gigaspora margarita]|uniref:31168_t:CDS:1 n=1 Tax=Gigaspora margarita TaxID=4874 RepID=A0ABN7UQE2_GIGMA|nr:31168_t:CDS:2 [Gigaspora margarita]
MSKHLDTRITHAIKRYIKLSYEIKVGEDIEEVIKDISEIHVAEITPNRQYVKDKPKFGTISGITPWNKLNEHAIANCKFFISNWVQKENQRSRNEFAKIAPRAKLLLEAMFVAETVNRKNKINAQQIYQELHKQVNKDELEPEKMPKLSTVQN